MISTFEIFRILIGLVVFIFIIAFFLRISDMYTASQITGRKIEVVNTFDQIASQVYTSENPSVFDGFKDFRSVVYEPPKVKSDAGQKTLSVPVFFIPGEGRIFLDKRCLDYEWLKLCWVYAFPESANIIFTPLDNSPEARILISSIAEYLTDSAGTLHFGYCSGDEARSSNMTGEFLSYLAGSAGVVYSPCTVNLPKVSRLVVINRSFTFPSDLSGDVFIETVSGSSGYAYEKNSTGGMQPVIFRDPLDAAIFITGGEDMLDFKRRVFARDLGVSTRIMRERTILVSQKIMQGNRQPCQECATLYPKECGWSDYLGARFESTLYKNFISSLGALEAAIPSGNYNAALLSTVQDYDKLRSRGCEQ